MTDIEYHSDPLREHLPAYGIPIRAKRGGAWGAVDINHLDKPSLLAWLRSRNDVPDAGAGWRESIILAILRHDP